MVTVSSSSLSTWLKWICGSTTDQYEATLADILSEIPLFWGHFQSNIPYFCLRIDEAELRMENWGWIKEIWRKKMEISVLRIQTNNTKIYNYPLSWVTVFWGHLSPSLFSCMIKIVLFFATKYTSASLERWSLAELRNIEVLPILVA